MSNQIIIISFQEIKDISEKIGLKPSTYRCFYGEHCQSLFFGPQTLEHR